MNRYCPFSGVSNLTDPPIAREVIRPNGRNQAEHPTAEQASAQPAAADEAEGPVAMPSVGTTGQRGYGRGHEAVRRSWAAKVDAGLVTCARCAEPLEPGRPWDLGHNEERTGWTGPEHRTCNRSAGAHNGALVAATAKAGVHTSREW